MPQQKVITVYSFDELAKEVQDEIILRMKTFNNELESYEDFDIISGIKSCNWEFLKNGKRMILPENTETKEIERESYTNC